MKIITVRLTEQDCELIDNALRDVHDEIGDVLVHSHGVTTCGPDRDPLDDGGLVQVGLRILNLRNRLRRGLPKEES